MVQQSYAHNAQKLFRETGSLKGSDFKQKTDIFKKMAAQHNLELPKNLSDEKIYDQIIKPIGLAQIKEP